MDVISKDNEKVLAFFKALDQIVEDQENMCAHFKPILNGEHFLTDKQVSKRLHISRRSLQDYRNTGKISYILLGGKSLYKESDIEEMLENTYYKKWE